MEQSFGRTTRASQGILAVTERVPVAVRELCTGPSATRVLIASNRLPVTAVESGGRIKFRRSDGGLAAGLRHVARSWPVRWYGWNGIASESTMVAGAGNDSGSCLISVPLNAAEVDGFYRDYSNSVLWPTLHEYPNDVPRITGEMWDRYVAVNMRFAEAIATDATRDDKVWVHDYHLLLVPRLLRMRGMSRETPIAFFLHTPFPEAGVFCTIAQHRALMDGVLGADIIGFHTEEYAANFLSAAKACGYDAGDDHVIVDGRRTEVQVRAMGIDAETFGRLGCDAGVLREVDRLRAANRTILLGVDRLDYTKGIPERLLAFESLLEERAELRETISFLQVAVPSRTDNTAYADLRRIVDEIVARINSRFGTPCWTPVEYLYGSVDLHTLAALYRAADVMLVTSCRDGLNLVAKEFIATRVDRDGVLVLSRFAGAAAELESALKCDPHRSSELAATMYRAITMPITERRSRMTRLLRSVTRNEIHTWIAHFLGEAPVAPVAYV
jgi:trehalose 6-phosphate synthase/phosphatase